MIKHISIALALALPVLVHAGEEHKAHKVTPEQQEAAAAQAKATPAPAVKGNKQHQKMGVCTKQAEAAHVAGQARKQFLLDCMKNAS